MRQYDHDVVIVGAGPTGLMLGAGLAPAGVDAAIVERKPARARVDGPTRVYSLLHAARPVLPDFAGAYGAAAGARVKYVRAALDGACALPVIGVVPLPAAALVRPDGYVAWAGDGGAAGLQAALAAWAGT